MAFNWVGHTVRYHIAPYTPKPDRAGFLEYALEYAPAKAFEAKAEYENDAAVMAAAMLTCRERIKCRGCRLTRICRLIGQIGSSRCLSVQFEAGKLGR